MKPRAECMDHNIDTRTPRLPSEMSGEELVAAVAVEVMPRETHGARNGVAIRRSGDFRVMFWDPLHDYNDTAEAVRRIRELGWTQVNINLAEDGLAYCWMKRPGPTKVANVQAPTAARAILEATLTAVRTEQ